MNITILGGNGRQGALLVEEALKRGHKVSIVIKANDTNSDKRIRNVIKKDILSIEYSDLKDADVIINAFGAWIEDTLPLHKKITKHLVDILSNKHNRLIIVGGAGSLFTDSTHTLRLMDSPNFPEEFKPLANAMYDAFDIIQNSNNINWTYFSPAADFNYDRPSSNNYYLGSNEVIFNANGESVISYKDYAKALIDEAENNKFKNKRFTISEK